jgi:hypothetical protein
LSAPAAHNKQKVAATETRVARLQIAWAAAAAVVAAAAHLPEGHLLEAEPDWLAD